MIPIRVRSDVTCCVRGYDLARVAPHFRGWLCPTSTCCPVFGCAVFSYTHFYRIAAKYLRSIQNAQMSSLDEYPPVYSGIHPFR